MALPRLLHSGAGLGPEPPEPPRATGRPSGLQGPGKAAAAPG